MKPARLSAVVGLVLLSSSGGSAAGWYDELAVPGTTITSGVLRVETVGTSVDVSGETAVIEASSRLRLAGEALTADLTLDVEGFTAPDGTAPADLEIQVRTDPAGQLDGSRRTWQVDRSDDGTRFTARIELPASEAQAITGDPRVTWTLNQAAPGQGWSSVAVHEISFSDLRPAAPLFPAVACAASSTTEDSITLSWTWDDVPTAHWQIVETNAAGNHVRIVKTIEPDGRAVYSATVPTQNDNWLYSVLASHQDGGTQQSKPVDRKSCAAADEEVS